MKIEQLKKIIQEQIKILNETNLSDLNTGEKFQLTSPAQIFVNGFLKKMQPSNVIFTVIKNTGKAIYAQADIDNKYKDQKGRVVFKTNATGHWRSQGVDSTIKKITNDIKIDHNLFEKEVKSIADNVLSSCANLLNQAADKTDHYIVQAPQNVRLATIKLFLNQLKQETLELQKKIKNF